MWRVKKFQGGSETMIRGSIDTTGESSANWINSPIQLSFTLPMCTANGLVVRTFRVFEKSAYNTTKWIRYLTQSEDYFFKI